MGNTKKRTTMAKINRENKVRERQAEKQARKDARKRAAAEHPPASGDGGTPARTADEPVG